MHTTPWLNQGFVSYSTDSAAQYISWIDAKAFVDALSTLTGKTFDLPTEAQWEYACRAGTTTRFYWGDDLTETNITNNAWYRTNAYNGGQQYAHIVGLKNPNSFVLYDMSGNVFEWCLDFLGTYPNASVVNPTGPTTGQSRVQRGGAWGSKGLGVRSAFRSGSPQAYNNMYTGLRVARISN